MPESICPNCRRPHTGSVWCPHCSFQVGPRPEGSPPIPPDLAESMRRKAARKRAPGAEGSSVAEPHDICRAHRAASSVADSLRASDLYLLMLYGEVETADYVAALKREVREERAHAPEPETNA